MNQLLAGFAKGTLDNTELYQQTEDKEMSQLTLTRREDEFIRIGSEIFIELCHALRGSAQITIHAPPEVVIVRDDIDDR
jgi:sRNA-binding carbon storage regulator CsrA